MATDFLYCKFNERGRKQFGAAERGEFEGKFPDYSKVGLPAHKAALDGNIDCLKDLFSAYWDDGVPSRDVNGATPLHLAVRNSRVDAVKWILRYTTLTPLDEAKFGETPVHVAAAQGNLECLKALMNAENKTEINALATAADKSEFTVLYLAILKQCNDCAKYLISQLGAKGVGPFNESGVTASHIAASAGNVEVLKLIHQKFKKFISLPAADGTTPVYQAAQQGQLEALKFLCEKCKCKLTVASEDGAKPIHAAAQCGKTNIVQYIVKHQGNKAVFDQGADKATPLHYAACNGHIETAEWLLKTDVSGRLILAKDKNGDTPAHDAAENGQTQMLKFLLDAGADLYMINDEGNTPYALALKGDNPDTANFVMTEAAKSPKANQQMPQVTIFDLQGEKDVVNLTPPSGPADMDTGLDEADVPLVDKPEKSKKSSKKKKKRRGSLNSGVEQTLQSFDKEPSSSKVENEGGDDGPLEFDEDGIELFENGNKADEEDDIVVRYTNKPAPAVLMTSEYSTVNEVARSEERKQRKKGRKIPKSIQNALKSGKKKVSDSTEVKKPSKSAFGLGNMGFKSKSNVNPLLNVRIPPTPPPTPATGASIAPSDEAPPQIMADIDEAETPPPEVTSESLPKRQSENSMLLDDTLQHLSSENSPPDEPDTVPAPELQTFFHSKSSSETKKKFEKFGPTTKGLRPTSKEVKEDKPKSENMSETKHAFVKLKPVSGKVGAIASSFSKSNKPPAPVEAKQPPFPNLKKTTLNAGASLSAHVTAKNTEEKQHPPFPNLKKTSTATGATPAVSDAAKKAPVEPQPEEKRLPFPNLKKTTVNSGTSTPAASLALAAKKPSAEPPKSDVTSESTEAKLAFVKLKSAASSASNASSEQKSVEEQSSTSLDSSEGKNMFVQLKKAQKSNKLKGDDTELSHVKLKKSTRTTPPRARAVYTKPGTEKASGASNELLRLMKDLSSK